MKATEENLHNGMFQEFDENTHADLKPFADKNCEAVMNRDFSLALALFPDGDRAKALAFFERAWNNLEFFGCEPYAVQFQATKGDALASVFFRVRVKTTSGQCVEDVMYDTLKHERGRWTPVPRNWESRLNVVH